jgi:hypothetical protein
VRQPSSSNTIRSGSAAGFSERHRHRDIHLVVEHDPVSQRGWITALVLDAACSGSSWI